MSDRVIDVKGLLKIKGKEIESALTDFRLMLPDVNGHIWSRQNFARLVKKVRAEHDVTLADIGCRFAGHPVKLSDGSIHHPAEFFDIVGWVSDNFDNPKSCQCGTWSCQ